LFLRRTGSPPRIKSGAGFRRKTLKDAGLDQSAQEERSAKVAKSLKPFRLGLPLSRLFSSPGALRHNSAISSSKPLPAIQRTLDDTGSGLRSKLALPAGGMSTVDHRFSIAPMMEWMDWGRNSHICQ
jgi:hypothetical protein